MQFFIRFRSVINADAFSGFGCWNVGSLRSGEEPGSRKTRPFPGQVDSRIRNRFRFGISGIQECRSLLFPSSPPPKANRPTPFPEQESVAVWKETISLPVQHPAGYFQLSNAVSDKNLITARWLSMDFSFDRSNNATCGFRCRNAPIPAFPLYLQTAGRSRPRNFINRLDDFVRNNIKPDFSPAPDRAAPCPGKKVTAKKNSPWEINRTWNLKFKTQILGVKMKRGLTESCTGN